MNNTYICKICGKESPITTIKIKEMLNGTNEEFEYYECEHCKSLQIKNIPNNMDKYYDNETYYSFNNMNKLIKRAITHLHKNYLYEDSLGNLISKFVEDNPKLYMLLSDLIKDNTLNLDSKILDIGCGSGEFLQDLANIGFNNLNGMEPFIEEEKKTNKFTIYKNFLEDFNPNKKYDLIFLKDSLEHMDNPYENLLKVKSLLNKNGIIIITIPIKTEYIWKIYGTNWFQLDAPRHHTTFTLKGFNELINRLGLQIEKIIFNSDPYSLIISEDYSNGKSMYSENAFASRNLFKNAVNKYFKKVNLKMNNGKKVTFKNLEPLINELNEKQSSDHALLLIKK